MKNPFRHLSLFHLSLILINFLLFLYAGYFFYGYYIRTRIPAIKSNSAKIDSILIKKADRQMFLLKDGNIIHQYKIALGNNPVGPKRCEGDGKTPEGNYIINSVNPYSSYHLSLRLNYPNQEDKLQAMELGCPPGGDIMIHGQPNRVPFFGKFQSLIDWTQGCIAVDNSEIREIWQLVGLRTPVTIEP